MTRKKRFSSAEDFKDQINKVIDELIKSKATIYDLGTNIQTSDIAEAFEVSTNTLRCWCHQYAGMSARKFFVLYRIEQAKVLLRAGGKPSVVSQKLAFSEHKVFSTLFKQVTNKTPKSYRNSTFCEGN